MRLLCEKLDDSEVLGNELQLEQVFRNFLAKAVKFNLPNGEIRIAARGMDETTLITISDTGIGIPSADLPRVFERFYGVNKARSREMGGTGLGLSIVKHVIGQVGTVKVDSRLGERIVFHAHLSSVHQLHPRSSATVC